MAHDGYEGPGHWMIGAPGIDKFCEAAPIELTYFAIRALGQVPQLCLEVAGYPYRYTLVSAPYFKAHLKPSLPFGRLPCVKAADGTIIVQSKAVLRYIAKVTGLAGHSESEHARCDMLHEMFHTEAAINVDEMKKLLGRSEVGATGKLEEISRRDTLDLTPEQKTRNALKFWDDLVSKSTSGWLLGGLGDGKADAICYVDLDLYWSLRPHVEILKGIGLENLVKFVQNVHVLPGMKRLLDSGRMMPDISESYAYTDDDLVKQSV